LLARPFEGAVTGWIVVFGALIIELAAAAITNRMVITVAFPILVLPIVVAFGFAVLQWWQVRGTEAERVSWWHESGVVAGAILWLFTPTIPASLTEVTNGRNACLSLPVPPTADCFHRAAQAFDLHNIAWWSAAGLIVVAAVLGRKSRIAAWAAVPTALAGCLLASNFLEQLPLHYQVLPRAPGSAGAAGVSVLGVLVAQLGFQQVHGFEEGGLFAGVELVEHAGQWLRGAVQPFTDHRGLSGHDLDDGPPPVRGVGVPFHEACPVEVGQHAADGGQGQVQPRS
jgi:hypothetical protein